VTVLTEHQSSEAIFAGANTMQMYQPSVSGYYRFATTKAKHFLMEEFRIREA